MQSADAAIARSKLNAAQAALRVKNIELAERLTEQCPVRFWLFIHR